MRDLDDNVELVERLGSVYVSQGEQKEEAVSNTSEDNQVSSQPTFHHRPLKAVTEPKRSDIHSILVRSNFLPAASFSAPYPVNCAGIDSDMFVWDVCVVRNKGREKGGRFWRGGRVSLISRWRQLQRCSAVGPTGGRAGGRADPGRSSA